MKKVLLNWRYYVITVLFSLGMLFIMASCGDPVEQMSFAKETFLRLFYFAIGFGSFGLLGKCIKYWEAHNLIPEFTKAGKEADDEWE